MLCNKHIVAFTGHRNYNGTANRKLLDIVTQLYAEGARTFRIGMAEGFDLYAGEAVLKLMGEHNDIILEAYIPWPTFSNRFKPSDRSRYEAILCRTHVVRYISTEYHKRVFHDRNDMLVDGADYLVAWWDGSPSGTGYTLGKARKNGCHILNLYPDPQLNLEL